MKMFNADLEAQLKEVFNDLTNDVTIALFTEEGCYSCEETTSYMEEVEALSDKIHLEKYTLSENQDLATRYQVEMVPSIVLLDSEKNYKRIKFNGIPAGHEINSFIPALLEVSGTVSELPEDLTKRIESIDQPVNIKVFITLACPHCPGAVQKAHKLALMNPNIHAEMVEAQTFSELSDRFNVSGVPKIVINDTEELLGNQPLEAFLSSIEGL